MRIYRHLSAIPEADRNGAVAVGNFDGVHVGHRTVIGEAGQFARAADMPWTVLSFEPHPRQLFNRDQPPFRLTPFRAKAKAVEELGVDVLVVLKFDLALCRCEAEDFVDRVLVDGLRARHVVAGYDFHFGHGRRGDCAMLLNLGREKGFDFTAVSAASDDGGGVYASTRVRELLWEGKPEQAAEVLGRPFAISGIVRHGGKLGRRIGYPTANMSLDAYIRPRFGIYAVRVRVDDDPSRPPLPGVANLGNRPTVDGTTELLEVYLFDFDEDLYGRRLNVDLLHFIRPEEKFPDVETMTARIAEDCEEARRLLG